ncbi:hypothetical protein ATCVMN08101_878R [Acanthocystis turfacea Chlorella virus MN0810.1]|nr:hypothetical protein ATCVMN08101_878R [Acanthocystis turfacea Chlorella virus MN0810.1]
MRHMFAVFIAIILMLLVAGVLYLRSENFANYPFKNDFMKLYYSDIAEDPVFIKKFPYWGTGSKVGLRCRKPNNEGCDTLWVSGKLVEMTPELLANLKCKYGLPLKTILTRII